jgi:hypothetical protein
MVVGPKWRVTLWNGVVVERPEMSYRWKMEHLLPIPPKFNPDLRGKGKRVGLWKAIVKFEMMTRTCRSNRVVISAVNLMIYSGGFSFKVDMKLLERCYKFMTLATSMESEVLFVRIVHLRTRQ